MANLHAHTGYTCISDLHRSEWGGQWQFRFWSRDTYLFLTDGLICKQHCHTVRNTVLIQQNTAGLLPYPCLVWGKQGTESSDVSAQHWMHPALFPSIAVGRGRDMMMRGSISGFFLSGCGIEFVIRYYLLRYNCLIDILYTQHWQYYFLENWISLPGKSVTGHSVVYSRRPDRNGHGGLV